MAVVREFLVRKVKLTDPLGDARFQGAFDGVAEQVVRTFEASGLEQYLGISESELAESLQVGSIHATEVPSVRAELRGVFTVKTAGLRNLLGMEVRGSSIHDDWSRS